MSNSVPTNELEPSPAEPETQEPVSLDWANITIAVRPDFKDRFRRAAARVGLNQSQFGRMILLEGVSRHERA